MAHREAILDPTGQSEQVRPAATAPRVRDLAGIRLGLLENGKPNAVLVLQTVAAQLRAAPSRRGEHLHQDGRAAGRSAGDRALGE